MLLKPATADVKPIAAILCLFISILHSTAKVKMSGWDVAMDTHASF